MKEALGFLVSRTSPHGATSTHSFCPAPLKLDFFHVVHRVGGRK
nr:hypothetical protein [Kibdelosporangium sp. MJ126-NF4]